MTDLLRPFDATANLTGMHYEEPFIVYGASSIDDEELAHHVRRYRGPLLGRAQQSAAWTRGDANVKILVIGATGTIGSAVAAALENRHEVVRASRRGPVRVDMDDLASIDVLFETVHDLDAVVCAAASGALTPLDFEGDVAARFQGKLLGQIHVLRRALHHLRDGGSVTLTGGVFDRPLPGASFGAMVNAGLEAFVPTAAIEMPRGLRVNLVSPGWIAETLASLSTEILESLDLKTTRGTPAAEVARAYLEAIEGDAQGHIFRP